MADKPTTGMMTATWLIEQGDLELQPIEVVGDDWRVFVNKYGNFTAVHEFYGSVEAKRYFDLEELAKKVRARARVKVSVPYVYLEHSRARGWQFRHGTATGVHGGTGNVLGTEGGSSSQLDTGYFGSRRHYMTPVPPDDQARAVELATTRDVAAAELEALLEKYRYPEGLKKAVGEAIRAKMQPEAGDA